MRVPHKRGCGGRWLWRVMLFVPRETVQKERCVLWNWCENENVPRETWLFYVYFLRFLCVKGVLCTIFLWKLNYFGVFRVVLGCSDGYTVRFLFFSEAFVRTSLFKRRRRSCGCVRIFRDLCVFLMCLCRLFYFFCWRFYVFLALLSVFLTIFGDFCAVFVHIIPSAFSISWFWLKDPLLAQKSQNLPKYGNIGLLGWFLRGFLRFCIFLL